MIIRFAAQKYFSPNTLKEKRNFPPSRRTSHRPLWREKHPCAKHVKKNLWENLLVPKYGKLLPWMMIIRKEIVSTPLFRKLERFVLTFESVLCELCWCFSEFLFFSVRSSFALLFFLLAPLGFYGMFMSFFVMLIFFSYSLLYARQQQQCIQHQPAV